MTTTDTPTFGDLYRGDSRRWLSAAQPLPTVVELARPFVQGLAALYELGQRGDALQTLLDVGEMRDESAAWLDVQRMVVEIVSAMAVRCTVGVRSEIEQAVRFVIDTITQVSPMTAEFWQDEIERIQDDPGRR